jgi:uncharacterized membrane protein (UPF0127 family)
METRRLWLLPLALLLAGCGSDNTSANELNSRTVGLPGGQKIRAEMRIHPSDIASGMMFRDSLAPDRGMLFMLAKEGSYPFWMFQVKIPLDMIWLSEQRLIVDIAENAQPCPGPAERCITYGGSKPAMYVLELAGGMAKKYNLQVGQQLDF